MKFIEDYFIIYRYHLSKEDGGVAGPDDADVIVRDDANRRLLQNTPLLLGVQKLGLKVRGDKDLLVLRGDPARYVQTAGGERLQNEVLRAPAVAPRIDPECLLA